MPIKSPTAKPMPGPPAKGMTKKEREAFEKGFRENEEALRRLAKP